MKHYNTAREILEASILDIEAGHWCKGDLAKYGETSKGVPLKSDDIGKDTSWWEDFQPYEKPMGCALGLISMYGGLGEEFKQQVDGVTVEGFLPLMPNEAYAASDTDQPVVEALLAVYEALPQRSKLDWEPETIDEYETAIYEYNDSSSCSQLEARDWFRRALALVTAEKTEA